MADYQYINETGVIVPDTADMLATVQDEFKAVFGDDMPTDAETPQGVLITAETIARTAVVQNNADVANQINPNIAGGVFLRAICALTGLDTDGAARSLVSGVTVTGVSGAILTAGAQAATAAGDLFEVVTTTTIGAGGTATVDFQSVEYGAIPCAANALTVIVTGILGWETVTNPTAAVLGRAAFSDAELRLLRRNTLALQSISTTEAQVSGLYAIEGVKSLKFLENTAATTETVSGISMVAHSVWACIDGGDDTEIATSLAKNKTDGAAWNGAESVVVTNPWSGQDFTVLFDRPTDLPVWVKVTVRVVSAVADPQTSVKDAVLAYAAGEIEGMEGFKVGESVSPFEIAGAVAIEVPGLYVQKVEVSDDGITYVTTEIALAINELASVVVGDITVTVL
jgi:hypothetical protein